MGKYTGVVRDLPSGSEKFGFIYSLDFPNLVPFDRQAHKQSANLVPGDRVSFEKKSSGTAYRIEKSSLKNYRALTRHEDVLESPGS